MHYPNYQFFKDNLTREEQNGPRRIKKLAQLF